MFLLELDDPWYVRDKKKDEQAERSRKRAALQDPLIKMNEFLEKKRKAEEKASGSASVMVRELYLHCTQQECCLFNLERTCITKA